MSARLLLGAVEQWLVDVHGQETVTEMLDVPLTREDRRARRIEELRAAGLLTHPAVEAMG